MRGVRQLKENIRAGDIFQAVLSDKLSVPFGGDPLELFEELTRLSPAPYRFYFDSGEGVYLGASPELLLKARAGVLETHPIAGTRPRGRTPAEERRLESQLLRSEKERAEHLMLVDLARNDVGRVSEPGSVRVEEYMQIHKYSGVMHLVSRVTGKLLKGAGSIEALASCFPAGTLSGAPKIRAMQLLSELEPEPRGFYGGAVVAASFTGDLDSCISIRCIEVRGGRAIVQAGAGIVADSQPAREYDEITHKSRIARTALGLAGAQP
jgi:anthranilate synthase component 1